MKDATKTELVEAVLRDMRVRDYREEQSGCRLKYTVGLADGSKEEVFTRTFKEVTLPTAGEREQRRQTAGQNLFESFGLGDFASFIDAVSNLDSGPPARFTTSRKNSTKGSKRAKGCAEWQPHKKTRVILAQVEEIFDECRDYPATWCVLVGRS